MAGINQDKEARGLPRGSPANRCLLSCKSEQDIQDNQDFQDRHRNVCCKLLYPGHPEHLGHPAPISPNGLFTN